MSRAQGIRGFFASQTRIPQITDKMLRNLGTHGLRAEEVRRYGKPLGIALSAIGHQL